MTGDPGSAHWQTAACALRPLRSSDLRPGRVSAEIRTRAGLCPAAVRYRRITPAPGRAAPRKSADVAEGAMQDDRTIHDDLPTTAIPAAGRVVPTSPKEP